MKKLFPVVIIFLSILLISNYCIGSASRTKTYNTYKSDGLVFRDCIKIKANHVYEPVYFFMLMGDGCFHLIRLNPPGYIDANGVYYENTWSFTVLDSNEYIGTVSICPEEGTAYC